MVSHNWTRRSIALAAAAAGLLATSQAAHGQAMSAVAWEFITDSAVRVTDVVRRRADDIVAAIAAGGGDSGFISVFGDGAGTPAERKRRTLAAGRDLGRIAFDERTQLLTLFDAYLAAPSAERWVAVQNAMDGMSGRLHAVERKLALLGAAGGATANDADSVVDDKVRMLESEAREHRPTTPSELAAFGRFRDAFATLVDEKARLAEQLARLGAMM